MVSMTRNPDSSIVEQGLYPAYMGIAVWSVLMVINRYAVTVLEANPWSLAFMQMFAGGLALLWIGGRSASSRHTLKHWYTWVIGILRLLSALFHIMALVVISATEAQFIIQMSMLFSLLLAWMFLGRRPPAIEIPGIFLILAGLVWLITSSPVGWGHPALWLLAGTALCFSLQSLFSELHPESNKALGVKGRARYTGVVMVVTSLVFFIATLLIAWTGQVQPSWLAALPTLERLVGEAPAVGAYLDPVVLAIAALVGVLVRGPAMYLSFLSIRYIKSENHVMIMAAMPFTIMGLESIVGLVGPLDTSMLGSQVVLTGLLITAGAVYMVFMRASRGAARRQAQERDDHLREAGGDVPLR